MVACLSCLCVNPCLVSFRCSGFEKFVLPFVCLFVCLFFFFFLRNCSSQQSFWWFLFQWFSHWFGNVLSVAQNA